MSALSSQMQQKVYVVDMSAVGESAQRSRGTLACGEAFGESVEVRFASLDISKLQLELRRPSSSSVAWLICYSTD